MQIATFKLLTDQDVEPTVVLFEPDVKVYEIEAWWGRNCEDYYGEVSLADFHITVVEQPILARGDL